MRQGSLDLPVPAAATQPRPSSTHEQRMQAVQQLAWEAGGRALELHYGWEGLTLEQHLEFLQLVKDWAVNQPVAMFAFRHAANLDLAHEAVLEHHAQG